jgi:hypothetical protein
MTRAEFEALSEADRRGLLNLDTIGLTDEDYFTKFGMTRAEFEALPEADQRRLRNLDTTGLTDEDYFTKFGMTRAEFEALSEADQRRLRNLDTTGLTDEDYFTKFGMTRAEFEALSEADQRRLRNLDTTGLTDEDYFTKFGMTRAAFEALPEAERRRLLNLDTGEIGKQYEAVDAQGNVLASAFLADRAAFDKFVADYPNTTVREAITQELGDEVLLYNPNDLNAPPVRERVGTPTYNMSRNAGLRTLEEIDELRKLTTPEAPATLIERQQAAITNQNTLDNLESLSPQELGLFAAEVAAYTEPRVGPSGVTPRRGIPINTQEAMRRAHAAGVSFPGIDPSLFGAAPRAQDFEVAGLAIIDPTTDLRAATGFVSAFGRGINFLGEQLSEVLGGTGTAFVDTAEGSQALKSLAQATNRFYIEGRTLAREFENLQAELVKPSANWTDADAIRALSAQRDLLEGDLARVQTMFENPQRYNDTTLSRARELEIYAQQLLTTYDNAIRAYGAASGGGSGSLPTLQDLYNDPSLRAQ